MKTALITTTINIPHVLAHYRAIGPDVRFFVAGDHKSAAGAQDFCASIPNCDYYTLDQQHNLGYQCSAAIGPDCIQRRNIALLEAIKWGADLIYSCDDDNIPLDGYYASLFFKLFNTTWKISDDKPSYWELHGLRSHYSLRASGEDGWFDVGQLLDPVAPHRGMPLGRGLKPTFDSVVGAKIGVAAGICLGDPDINAVTRIARAPNVHRVSEVLRSGIVVDPKQTWTVFNSQNTAFIRELAPAFFMLPFVGRMDDIYASLIMQRVMREKNLHVHFGQPFVLQQRNLHSLVNDLRGEIDGMENVFKLAGALDNMPRLAVDKPVIRQIWDCISQLNWMPERTSKAAFAFLDDIEAIL